MAEDSLKYLSYLINSGDTIKEEAYSVEVIDFDFDHEFDREQFADIDDYDFTVAAHIRVTDNRSKKIYEVYPGLGVRDALIFTLPEVIDPLGIKLKLNEESFKDLFTEESALDYENINLKLGESIKIGDQLISLNGFDRSPVHPNYEPQDGDIAVGAQISVIRKNKEAVHINPIYIIQNLQPFSIKDYNAELGIHVRFSHIEPSTGQMTFAIAYDKRSEEPIELLIAESGLEL